MSEGNEFLMESDVKTGFVTYFNQLKGYGFICDGLYSSDY